MDCFYAQVEMIRHPELRDKPLGVQQKSLLVTCNYEARRLGVSKCMTLREAKEKLPELVLVSGEDLTPYREMSYKVTELLEEFSGKVERLGFDENFIDITELVDKKLQEPRRNEDGLQMAGHVYADQAADAGDRTHLRLVTGSLVAAEIRAAVHSRLGLTGCAGIASNKLLAKLVSGTYKPNQQTVLLPESSGRLIHSLRHVGEIPGIGHKTAQRLEALGLCSVPALQTCPISVLEKELGAALARRVQQLSRGEDDSAVTPTGAPQSISEEDSFKKCSTVSDVRLKLEELLTNLLNRMYADGRSPGTLRLSLRQSSASNKYWNRESRQCPVPKSLIQNLRSENAVSTLMDLLMKLFEKMIDVKSPFHLTLLNVCFSNLKAAQPSSSRSSIGFYLSQKKPAPADSSQTSQKEAGTWEAKDPKGTSPSVSKKLAVETSHATSLSLPDNIDMDVFNQLPEDIRREILCSPQTARMNKANQTKRPSPKGIQSFFVKANTKHPHTSGDKPQNLLNTNMSPVTIPEHPKLHKNRQSSTSKDDPSSVSSSSCLLPSCGMGEVMVDSQCWDLATGTTMACAPSRHWNTETSTTIDCAPSHHQDTKPNTTMDCAPSCHQDTKPNTTMDCAPSCHQDTKPNTTMDCAPSCHQDTKPNTTMDCSPSRHWDTKPNTTVDCAPSPHQDSKPNTTVDCAPSRHWDTKPNTTIDCAPSPHQDSKPNTTMDCAPSCHQDTKHNVTMDCAPSRHSDSTSFLPQNVDISVFSQLPPELQKELMTDWKNKKLTPKIPVTKSNGKVKSSKGQRQHSSTKTNNLLNYFKPG
ncbi:DNA polymerase iota [Gastrophryne carolinensis]